MPERRGIELADLLAVWSLVLGYENLAENREQSAHNDVSKANAIQATALLDAIGARLDEQDSMLRDILEAMRK